jgi:hypothetical protein
LIFQLDGSGYGFVLGFKREVLLFLGFDDLLLIIDCQIFSIGPISIKIVS